MCGSSCEGLVGGSIQKGWNCSLGTLYQVRVANGISLSFFFSVCIHRVHTESSHCLCGCLSAKTITESSYWVLWAVVEYLSWGFCQLEPVFLTILHPGASITSVHFFRSEISHLRRCCLKLHGREEGKVMSSIKQWDHPSVVSRIPAKKPGVVTCACNPNTGITGRSWDSPAS